MTQFLAVFLTIAVSFAPISSNSTSYDYAYEEADYPIAASNDYEDYPYESDDEDDCDDYDYDRVITVVNPEEWAEILKSMWDASHEDPFTYEMLEEDPDMEYPTFVLGSVGNPITLELYRSNEYMEYWMHIDYSREDVPLRKVEAYDTYFLDIILTGLSAQFEEMTVGQSRELRTQLIEKIDIVIANAVESDYGFEYIYYGDTYISLYYDAQWDRLDCTVLF